MCWYIKEPACTKKTDVSIGMSECLQENTEFSDSTSFPEVIDLASFPSTPCLRGVSTRHAKPKIKELLKQLLFRNVLLGKDKQSTSHKC